MCTGCRFEASGVRLLAVHRSVSAALLCTSLESSDKLGDGVLPERVRSFMEAAVMARQLKTTLCTVLPSAYLVSIGGLIDEV